MEGSFRVEYYSARVREDIEDERLRNLKRHG
jgi:uncharacterized membrane protein